MLRWWWVPHQKIMRQQLAEWIGEQTPLPFCFFYVVKVRTCIFEYQALRQVQKFYMN